MAYCKIDPIEFVENAYQRSKNYDWADIVKKSKS